MLKCISTNLDDVMNIPKIPVSLWRLIVLILIGFSIGACASQKRVWPVEYTQHRWVLTQWEHPLYAADKDNLVRLNFDGQDISIVSVCNHFYSHSRLKDQILHFSQLRSTNIHCDQEQLKQDQLIINAIRNSKISKITDEKLMLQPENAEWPPLYFTAQPKPNQKGVVSHIWEIDTKMAPCLNTTTQKMQPCLKTRALPDGEWTLFAHPIEGFQFQEGVRYRVKILEQYQETGKKYVLDAIVGQLLIGTRQAILPLPGYGTLSPALP